MELRLSRDPLQPRQRDYLSLTVFVYAQHGHFDKAQTLIEGMEAIGDNGDDVLLSRAVLAFFNDDFNVALSRLDRLDERAKGDGTQDTRADERARMRNYLRARCLFQLGREDEAKAIANQMTQKPRAS
ncbi:MAG: hypothetical protein AAGE61_17255 [Pseudomonadota bacterium]